MKKILLLLVSIVSFTGYSQAFTPKNWVTDLGNFYTPEEEVYLNKKISDYEKLTSIEIGVVTIDSLGDNSIEQFASDQFKRIGVGKKGADNGILIVFSMKDRKSRIEVGNGMEPFFTDINAYDALEVVKPSFREGKYSNGTSDCIQFITNKLGNQAFSNKVLWLKQKQEKEAKESAESWYSFRINLLKGLVGILFLGGLYLIYYTDKKKRERIAREKELIRLEEVRVEKVKNDTLDIEKYLKSITINNISCNSKILSNLYQSVRLHISSIKVSDKINHDVYSQDVYLNNLKSLKNNIDSKINTYNELNSEYRSRINSLSNIDYQINDAKSVNSIALLALEEIKNYGYSKNYKDLSNSIDELDKVKESILVLVNSDVDSALDEADELRSRIDSLYRESKNVTSYLESIKDAKSKIKASDVVVTGSFNEINRYKSYLQNGELEKVEQEYEKFKKSVSNSTDYLALFLTFGVLLLSLSNLTKKVKGRKQDEEDEERRKREEKRRKQQEQDDEDRRRRNSYSSSSSYGSSSSSSDSGSSFGGFGGGSSSGGGASSGW